MALPVIFAIIFVKIKKGTYGLQPGRGLSYFDGEKFTTYTIPKVTSTLYFNNCKVDAQNQFSYVINGRNIVLINGRLQYTNPLKDVPGLPKKSTW